MELDKENEPYWDNQSLTGIPSPAFQAVLEITTENKEKKTAFFGDFAHWVMYLFGQSCYATVVETRQTPPCEQTRILKEASNSSLFSLLYRSLFV